MAVNSKINRRGTTDKRVVYLIRFLDDGKES